MNNPMLGRVEKSRLKGKKKLAWEEEQRRQKDKSRTLDGRIRDHARNIYYELHKSNRIIPQVQYQGF